MSHTPSTPAGISAGALRALEFDRVVSALAAHAVTPTGRLALEAIVPRTDATAVTAAQRATTEGVRFLARHPGFPLRAPADLLDLLGALGVEGRPLEPLRLIALADYLDSIESCRSAIRHAGGDFPILERLVEGIASFRDEIADVRRKIDPSGEVADNATPALASIRSRLRAQRSKLRSTLDGFLRGRDTAKYLQDQVVTDRNGRYVLVVRAEHRGAIPGIIHGSSASGASLYLEPLGTVEINNDIVALEQEEAEEVYRILVALTDLFRARSGDLQQTTGVATDLDVIQARARLSEQLGGTEPVLTTDGTLDVQAARHPLLVLRAASGEVRASGAAPRSSVVPVDIQLVPPTRILVIAGPNTGGKTVALKTAGLLVLMAQAGLHIPAEPGSRLPVFRSVFADIGDDQSLAASLRTFSAHITNIVSMERQLALPGLVLLDEIGAGTDPAEGGALGIAVIDHFRTRGAHLVATTHYDALKSYASTTDGVVSAGFGFDPETFAPTYRLIYRSTGRSLAIEIAKRLGMPAPVVAAARNNLSDGEKQLNEHLARVDEELRRLERERKELHRERAAVTGTERMLKSREASLTEREEALRRRVSSKVDDQVRDAKREIDAVLEALKQHATALSQAAAKQHTLAGGTLRPGSRAAGDGTDGKARPLITTGETGLVRSEARAAIDAVVAKLKDGTTVPTPAAPPPPPDTPIEPGVRVIVGGLGLEGIVVELQGKQAEIDVRGKRLRAPIRDLRVIGGKSSGKKATVNVNVDLQPRDALLSELNVIGCNVEEALTRAERFLDAASLADQRSLRIVHGHGTGQLRRAIADFLKHHPLVATYALAPQEQGGGGATVVELKD